MLQCEHCRDERTVLGQRLSYVGTVQMITASQLSAALKILGYRPGCARPRAQDAPVRIATRHAGPCVSNLRTRVGSLALSWDP